MTVEPGVTDKQKVAVLVGRHVFNVKIPPTPGAVLKTLPPITIPAKFPITGTKELFLLRIRIDGADSFVKRDDKLGPTYDEYIPFVEIAK